MLYLLTLAKMIFPLITLPYLTRVLSTDNYAIVSYEKSFSTYLQLIIDFGFLLSAVKDIVEANNDKEKIGIITGHVLLAKVILALAGYAIFMIIALCIPILRENYFYTFLTLMGIFLTCFLADYLFRGIEKMHVLTLVFLLMKGISTILTFVLVKNDSQLFLIPVLDIIGSLVAVLITWLFILKYKIKVRIFSIKLSLKKLSDSFTYFISNMATTAFGAFNTIMIGIVILDKTQIAYWTLTFQLVTAVQNLYSPIINGIYPQMIRRKSLKVLKYVMLIIMPIVICGCAFCFFASKWILNIFGGEKYIDAYILFRCFIPVLFFSFPAMLFGWPALGVINKQKIVTISTICTAILQVSLVLLMLPINQFTLINLALIRGFTELFMMIFRMSFVIKYRDLFTVGQEEKTITE